MSDTLTGLALAWFHCCHTHRGFRYLPDAELMALYAAHDVDDLHDDPC
jgi:hypothetical protein